MNFWFSSPIRLDKTPCSLTKMGDLSDGVVNYCGLWGQVKGRGWCKNGAKTAWGMQHGSDIKVDEWRCEVAVLLDL